MQPSQAGESAGAAIPADQKGAPGGLAELDESGHVPASQLPSYVDDVVDYPNRESFPQTGEDGKIYVAEDTNITYRWSGSAYVPIGSDLALGETSSTAYRGDRGKTAYDHSQIKKRKSPWHQSGRHWLCGQRRPRLGQSAGRHGCRSTESRRCAESGG